MGFLKNSLRLGLIVGIGIPVFLLGGLLLFFDAQQSMLRSGVLAGLAALCALPNLGFFFFALRQDKDAFAHGVLWSCILWALFTFGLKLFG